MWLKKSEDSSLNIGDMTNIGVIEDEYKDQYKINNKWYSKKLVKPSERLEYESAINQLKQERGNGYITLYHGTDPSNYKKIIETNSIGDSEGRITFFTSNKAEAEEYARNKAKYRGYKEGKVLKILVPLWAVNKNAGTGEYETEFVLTRIGDKWQPIKENVESVYHR